jgi:hypothetical protein
MPEIIVFETTSSGATAANDEMIVENDLKQRMKRRGGRRGLWVSYKADIDSEGVFQNFGLVRIVADSESAAQRYKDAAEGLCNVQK